MSALSLLPSRAVILWLWSMVVLVAAMILLGGAVRLTGSGLSIVEWELVTGILPPLSESEWREVFLRYQETPEFQRENAWMALDDFRVIYWWEWIHRFAGRLLGLAYVLPLGFFVWRGVIRREWTGRLLALLALGALQGAVGWWMVQSGLVDRVDVDPVRLAVHLALAFAIFGLLIDTALRIDERALSVAPADPALRLLMGLVAGLVFVQVFGGALVAGSGAGRIYTDWPWMAGRWLPEVGPLTLSLDLLGDHALVQFQHRLLAYVILALAVLGALRARRARSVAHQRAAIAVLAAVLVQVTLGVATLVAASPPSLGLIHQAGAVVLFGVTVAARRVIRGRIG